jgi:hypothetical protein
MRAECMLWHAKRFTKKAAERAHQYSNDFLVTPFDFLQRLPIRFGVFVPIDLSIDKSTRLCWVANTTRRIRNFSKVWK